MDLKAVKEAIKNNCLKNNIEGIKLYPSSHNLSENTAIAMVATDEADYLLAVGEGPLLRDLHGYKKEDYCLAPLSHENRLVLNRYFKFTRPVACSRKGT